MAVAVDPGGQKALQQKRELAVLGITCSWEGAATWGVPCRLLILPVPGPSSPVFPHRPRLLLPGQPNGQNRRASDGVDGVVADTPFLPFNAANARFGVS